MNNTAHILLKKLLTVLIILLVSSGVAGCGAETPGPVEPPTGTEPALPSLQNAPDAAINAQEVVSGNEAVIESVEILIMESFPVQVRAVVSGYLPNSCASIGQVNQAKNDDTFVIAVGTVRQTGVMCAEQNRPFEEAVSLDVAGLPAGSYTVTATASNSIDNTFALTVDNNAPQPPPPPNIVGASITGIVWDDTCVLAGDGLPATGCVTGDGGTQSADGLFSSAEARIPGVIVQLKAGECPGSEEAIGSAITDETGTFLFPGLRAGTYCLGIDAAAEENAAILSPGNWSYPAPDSKGVTVVLAEDDYQTIDFGWEFRAGEETEPFQNVDCYDAALYVADVTIPDDTVLLPEEPFEKTWRIRNTGSCTWGTGYSMQFESGNSMGVSGQIPITQMVEPGGEADITIPLVAPTGVGTHRSNWLIRNPAGDLFGSGGNIPFYAQIVVNAE